MNYVTIDEMYMSIFETKMIKKVCAVGLILFYIVLVLSSCNGYDVQISEPIGETDMIVSSTEEEVQTIIDKTIVGITTVEYPDPYIVTEYEVLTEDQKIAYDSLGLAVKDILENGPVAGKMYSLPKRIDWLDYKVAYNVFVANFTSAEDIIANLTYMDSQGKQKSVDGIFLFDDGKLDSYYQKYIEISQKADEILSELEHDGTEYGKALAIAKWMVENIIYPSEYTLDEYLNTAYTALMHKKAVCDGYAKAFDFLCKKAGLESIYVTSFSTNSGHAWNMIHIGENWYHVDITWMYSGEFYKNFMMSDDICASTGHSEAEYYWDQKANKSIIPFAQSDCYYSYPASKGMLNN